MVARKYRLYREDGTSQDITWTRDGEVPVTCDEVSEFCLGKDGVVDVQPIIKVGVIIDANGVHDGVLVGNTVEVES